MTQDTSATSPPAVRRTPGALSQALVALLQRKPPGTRLDAQAIATAPKVPRVSVSSGAVPALKAGTVVREKEGNGYVYLLAPPPPKAAGGALQLAAYSDGDVVVTGGVLNTDNSVTFSRAQLQQLFAFCNTPYLAQAPAAQGATDD